MTWVPPENPLTSTLPARASTSAEIFLEKHRGKQQHKRGCCIQKRRRDRSSGHFHGHKVAPIERQQSGDPGPGEAPPVPQADAEHPRGSEQQVNRQNSGSRGHPDGHDLDMGKSLMAQQIMENRDAAP